MEKKKRNRIIIIGNGFDLAHGFKTSYGCFIDWLWDKKVGEINTTLKEIPDNKQIIDSDNLFIVSEGKKGKFENANELKKWITYKNGLFEAIEKKRNKLKDPKWSDIEDVYYESLLKCHEHFNAEKEETIHEDLSITKLNRDFRVLRTKLLEYLDGFAYNPAEAERLEFKNLVSRMKNIFNALDANGEEIGKILFICFNYTKTLELYGYSALEVPFSNSNFKIVYIHGSLSDDNSVIFGYGDELDSYSMNVRENKDNAFLEFNKAVLYARSGEYQKIISDIYGEDDYEVFILGHSCANSDRALLNEIFTNDHCKFIKYYYFDGGQGKEANFREQISNLYRIFGNNHRKFRSVFCPLSRSERIPQIRDIENYVIDEGTTASTNIIEILGIQFIKVQGSILPDGTKVGDFLIGRFPITELQWKNIIGKSRIKHEIKGDDFPIVGVYLLECVEFIREFNSQTGRKAFLPSLTQWKYAAQGGNVSKNYIFAGSDNLDEVGWYKQNSDNQLHPVGKKKPNELGIYDMSGNVWEYATGFSKDILYDATCRTIKETKEWNLAIEELNQQMQLETYALGVGIPKYNLPNIKATVVGGGYHSPSTHCRTVSKKTIEEPNNSIGFRIVINLDNDSDK